MTARAIVLDANILVRAVLGTRVSELLAAHAAQATFLAPDIAFDEAREHLPTVLAKRGKSAEAIQAVLEKLETLAHVIVPVPAESYLPFKDRAVSQHGPWPASSCFSPSQMKVSRTPDRSALASRPFFHAARLCGMRVATRPRRGPAGVAIALKCGT